MTNHTKVKIKQHLGFAHSQPIGFIQKEPRYPSHKIIPSLLSI